MADSKLCPACGSYLPIPRITTCSWSRFVDRYVCNTCGRRETSEGFFWRDKAMQQGIRQRRIEQVPIRVPRGV